MSSTKITSLYHYLLFYGAVPHAVNPDTFRRDLPNEDNFYLWREHHRLVLDERTPLILPPGCIPPAFHWPHIRIVKDEETPLVAFYASEDAARRDRRTRCTYGRYLTKHFHGILTTNQITELATQFRGNYGNNCLLFAKTPQEITNVFLTGPNSCMSKAVNHYGTGGVHPSVFYANGITEVAFLRNRGKITARTVTLKAQKKFSTVYGDQAIRDKLKTAGYTPGDLNGIDFPIVEHASNTPVSDHIRFILPFIDGSSYGLYHYENATIRFFRHLPTATNDTAPFSPRNTDGMAHVLRNPPGAIHHYICVHCRERCDTTLQLPYTTTNGETVCPDCSNEHYTTLRTTGHPTYHHGVPPGDIYQVHGYPSTYCQAAALNSFQLTALDHKFDERGTRVAAHSNYTVRTITGLKSLREDCIRLRSETTPDVYIDPRLEMLDDDEKVYVDNRRVLMVSKTTPDSTIWQEFSTTSYFREARAGLSGHILTLFADHYNHLLQRTA